MGAQFNAKYKGRCDYCHEEIEVGDPCSYWQQRLYHYECKKTAYWEANKDERCNEDRQKP